MLHQKPLGSAYDETDHAHNQLEEVNINSLMSELAIHSPLHILVTDATCTTSS